MQLSKEERKAYIERRLNEGAKQVDLAAELGVSEQAISFFMKKHGIQRARSLAKYLRLKEAKDEGLTMDQIATELGVHKCTLQRWGREGPAFNKPTKNLQVLRRRTGL